MSKLLFYQMAFRSKAIWPFDRLNKKRAKPTIGLQIIFSRGQLYINLILIINKTGINEKNELLPDKPFEKPYNSQNSSNPQKTSKTKDLVKFSKEKQSIFIDKPIERSFSSKKYQELPLSSNMKNSSKIVPIGGISQFLIDKFFRRLN